MTRFGKRRAGLLKLVKQAGADGLLVSNLTNVTYLTGFTGDSSHLLITARDTILVSDFRYITQLEEECPDLRTHIRPNTTLLRDAVIEVVAATKLRRLAIEGDWFSIADHNHLKEKLPRLEVTVSSGLVEGLRQVKDNQEIAEIREAVRIAERSFAVLRATLRPKRTEKELADDLEHQLRLGGALSSSFPPIVAAGARAALPHARPTDAAIDGEDFLLVDWGASARGYKSDLTRVLVIGRISPKLERVYGVVLKAQEQAIAAIRPGKTGREIDAIARGIIADAGFGKYFGHGLGHGIGLDIHELPRLSGTNEQPLQPGMVVTVEPGIYLPGWGGVRIEDDVLVTKQGHEVLTSCPKQLADAVVN
ncbi:MAG TPA: Xaa-Pro peptidase family protein [Pirellulales bacterium]|jgi:Xaa-Pro aminopeptidase|nr:Xaa-Pro peptidase family protein [Pirellulales bacterium]